MLSIIMFINRNLSVLVGGYMKKLLILLFTLMVLFIIGCSQTKLTCNEPYVMSPAHCCLDKDINGVCDNIEASKECEFDCSTCPSTVVTEKEEVEVYKYVCEDGETVVDDVDLCAKIRDPVINFNPVTTNEDREGHTLQDFRLRPACRGGHNALEVYFKVGDPINKLIFQVKEKPTDQWKDVYEYDSNVFEEYLYGTFCDSKCTTNSNFFISPGKKYLMRLKFDYRGAALDKVYYSNEHIVDATEDGEYSTKLC